MAAPSPRLGLLAPALTLILAGAACDRTNTAGPCAGAACAADAATDRGSGLGSDGGSEAAPGLLADYEFDDGMGTVAVDSSGNYFNGGLIGMAGWGTGHSGGDVTFTGGSVVLPPDIVSSARALSVMAWVRLRTDRLWQRVFDFGSGTGSYLFLTPRSDQFTVRFAITRGGAANEQRVEVATSLPVGTWKHLAIVLTGTSGTLYIDGQPVATGDVTLHPSDLGSMPNDWLGRSEFTPPDPAFDGEIDGLRIYSRALAASEIAAAFAGP